MSRIAFDEELAHVRARLDSMAANVRRMLALACQAFATGDVALANAVIDRDATINQMERDNDAACLVILARRQPVGCDLRFLVAAFRVVTDLERVGDLAVNIAEQALASPRRMACDLEPLAMLVMSSLLQATTAFFTDDTSLAHDVIAGDGNVDAEWLVVAEALMREMRRDPTAIDAALRHRTVAKCLERCADHATNIAEALIFKVRGDDVRHSGPSALVSMPPR